MIDICYAANGPAPASQGSFITSLLPLAIIFVIFYFLLIRPQQKQQQKHKDMLSKLKKGDRVLTSGGLYGVVVGVNEKDNIVVLTIAENVKVEVSRESIATVKGTTSA